MTTALASTKDSEVQTTVVTLAAGQMETLRASAVLVDDTTDGDFGTSFPKYKWSRPSPPARWMAFIRWTWWCRTPNRSHPLQTDHLAF